MATTAKKLTYTLKAEYEGATDLKKLSDDLKALNKIEVLKNAEQDFADAKTQFAKVRDEFTKLNTELKASSDSRLGESWDKAKNKAAGLADKVEKQTTALDILQREVGNAKTKYAQYAQALEKDPTDKNRAAATKFAEQLEKLEIKYDKQKLQLEKNQTALDGARKKAEALRTAFENSVDPKTLQRYKQADTELQKIFAEMRKQKTTINETRTALQQEGVQITKVADQYDEMRIAAENQARVIASRQKLEVQSFKSIESEITALKRAYTTLEESGELSIKELTQAKQKLINKTAQLNAAMGKTTAKSLANGWQSATTKLNSFVSPYVGLMGLMAAGYGLSRMVSDVTQGARELENFARIAGTSPSQFSAYAVAVQSVGLEADKLADMSKDVKDKIGDYIETGGGEFADFMNNVASATGVTAEELIKLSGPDALIAVKKAMDDANVPMENQVFYLEALANDASLLMPLLANNGEKFKELAQHAQEMGIAVSDLDMQQLLELDQSMRDLETTMGIVKRDMVIALTPALKDLSTYFKENQEEIREFATSIAEAIGSIGKFIIENREIIAMGLKVATALYGVNTAASLTYNSFKKYKDIKTLLSKLNFTSILTGLGKIRPTLSVIGTSATATGGLAVAAFASMAWGIYRNVKRYQELKKIAKETAEVQEETARTNQKVADKFKEISTATGVTVTSMDELDQAVEDGKIHFDSTTGEWVAGAGKMADAVEESASKQKTATVRVTQAMKDAYQKLADQVIALQDKIANRQQSLTEQLRSMARTGMSDYSAWKDLKAEADEYYDAAVKAAAAGDYDQAVEYADKAKEKYAQLNTEIKDGDEVIVSQQQALKTAMAGVKDAGNLAIDILEDQKEAAAQAADQLNEESGYQLAKKNLSELNTQVNDMSEKAFDFSDNWDKTFSNFEKTGYSCIDGLQVKLDKLATDRTITYTIKEVTANSQGGYIGAQLRAAGGYIGKLRQYAVQTMAGGGGVRSALAGYHFAGYGGGDRAKNLVMAEDGEVMLRKEAVKAGGLRAALAFNQGNFGVVLQELLQRLGSGVRQLHLGGPVSWNAPALRTPLLMAGGGAVSAAATGSSSHYSFDFQIPGTTQRVRATTDKENFEMMTRYARRKQRIGNK